MSRVKIEKNICIEPRFLNKDLYKHLLETIRERMIGYCDCEYGYILEIYNGISILENNIATTGSQVYFKIGFHAKTLKPEIGSEYEGKVFMILPQGILVNVDKMKIFIPNSKLGNYKYNKTNFIKGNKSISMNDNVNLVIEATKYEKQNFSCIGSLKE